MKKVLFAGLLAIAGVSVSAQNLIKNEKFATEVKTKVTNANKATAGEWFIMNNEADGDPGFYGLYFLQRTDLQLYPE